MAYPVFASGDVLNASDMNAVGLWLVKSQTVGTGVSSVQVTGAFSSSYNSYKIIYTGGTGSTDIDLNLTLGSTTSGYKWSAVYTTYNSTPAGAGSAAGTYFGYAASATSTWAHGQFELHNPFGTARTFFNAQNVNFAAGINSVGFLNDATSYTSFTLTCSSGTITGGTIRVYGYKP